MTPAPADGQQDTGLAGRLAAECKAAAAATASLWPDTSDRLARLGQALQARQDQADGE